MKRAPGRALFLMIAVSVAAWLPACGSSSSPGATGAAGAAGGAAVGTGGGAGHAAAGAGVSTGGQGGGVATGGHAGATSTGGHAGATSTGGAGGAAAGGAGGAAAGGAGGGTPCAPCYLSIVDRVKCDPSPTATCVEEKSQTTAADGTITKIDNKCYSDGSKNLQRQTVGPVDAGLVGTESVAVQVVKNGAACASGDISYTGTTSDETVTELLKDGAGSPLATIVIKVTRVDGGAPVQTETITCPGQAPQILGTCPSSSGTSISCTAGTCM